jgi:hypothetical protein
MKLVTICPESIKKEYIYFNEPIQNNVINESRYIRILYSTPNIVFNGIHVLINLSVDNMDRQYNKNILYYNTDKNTQTINSIKKIEKTILKKYSSSKNPSYNLSELLDGGIIRLFSDYTEKRKVMNIILKISGLWEDDDTYGITYKFFSV